MEGSNLKASLNITIEIFSDRVPLQIAIFRFLYMIQSLP